jgi:hypothetical protein
MGIPWNQKMARGRKGGGEINAEPAIIISSLVARSAPPFSFFHASRVVCVLHFRPCDKSKSPALLYNNAKL